MRYHYVTVSGTLLVLSKSILQKFVAHPAVAE
jgi:hypothetical protein